MKKILLMILMLLFAVNCSREKSVSVSGIENEFSKKKYIAVVLVDYTALRIDPVIYSSKVDQLKKGDILDLIEKSTTKTLIGKNNDYWFKVKTDGGLKGWVFGGNLKLFEKGKDYNIDDFRKQIDEEKIEKIKKTIKGRWWSINPRGDFTNQSLKLFENGKYLSSWKNGKEIEGTFSIDLDKMELVFSGKTTFNVNVKLLQRGQDYDLKYEQEDKRYGFKKLSNDPDEKADELILEDKSVVETEKKDDAGKNNE